MFPDLPLSEDQGPKSTHCGQVLEHREAARQVRTGASGKEGLHSLKGHGMSLKSL